MEVDVVGMNIDKSKPPDEKLHRGGVVIHAVLQDGLAANGDAAFGQAIHSAARHTGDFAG